MLRYTITTLGCKVNQSESDTLTRELDVSGWSCASKDQPADLCIINTCTVTGKASMQSRQATRRAIRSHPGARIVVTGCYAQTEPDVLRKIEGISAIVPREDKELIPEMVMVSRRDSSPSVSGRWSDMSIPSAIPAENLPHGRSRPFLKIQDGCDAFCTYCIVPYARGKSCSTPPEDIIRRIQQLGKEGYHEVVLTGVHLGVYGMELTPKTRLASLLHDIDASRSIDRVRLSSIEPGELTAGIIDLVAEAGTFCHHFHIPLQSGDDTLLERMHRPYDRELFRDVVLAVHRSVPDAAIGADVLVGFPGETEMAFENTYALIDELPISYLHVFPFSPRKGTPASRYPDQIATGIIRKRCGRIRALGDEKRNAFYRQAIGKRVEIVLEGKASRAKGFVKGITSNYIPVLIPADDQRSGSMVHVRIDKVDGSHRVFGTVC